MFTFKVVIFFQLSRTNVSLWFLKKKYSYIYCGHMFIQQQNAQGAFKNEFCPFTMTFMVILQLCSKSPGYYIMMQHKGP